ncbi:E3 ubiquitin-protein ligase TRIM7-like [Elgaria multicarinata webbii]|uniref:E3 ubiquitin-protein ligase TRIM7-like n=1 Tax=Elgaria multicarinata webbii TaxID=159646 RepID=UPI002FCD6042
MADAESPRKRLQEEATCSVCLDFFTDPVTIDCGHNFCRACIEKCWRNSPTDAACPECRERVQQPSLKPNRLLANMVEIAKELSFLGSKEVKAEGRGEKVCETHQEPLKLFCKDDEAAICVVCDRSKEHRDHNVVPLQEAAQEYKDLIHHRLEILRKEREEIMAFKVERETEIQALLEQLKARKEKTVVHFQQLRQFLVEQEKLFMAQMEEVEKKIAMKRDEQVAKISELLLSLERMMQEMAEKRQQSVSELLQDIKCTLKRCEKNTFEKSVVYFSPALRWRISDVWDMNFFLEGSMKQFQDTLVSGLQLKKANILLNPYTANPQVILSEDFRSASLQKHRQDLPDNPERFDRLKCVLGCEGFTAGRHYWEVSVGNEGAWAVGVARESVRRKGMINFGSEEGIWNMGRWNSAYRASDSPDCSPLSLSKEPKRIRVSLNYEGRVLAFHDADTATLIYTYSVAPFSGETLFPFFWVWGKAHLTLSP